MGTIVDISGQVFGRLTVMSLTQGGKSSKWLCLCECGSTVSVFSTNLRGGHSASCGCLREEQRKERSTRHGNAKDGKPTRTYKIWIGLRERCNNPRFRNWQNYGGRAISVCERWNSFENFLADMGEQPPGLTIERVNNELGYEPGNCVWATTAVQARNRRNNLRITVCGREMVMRDACAAHNVNYFSVCSYRIERGLTSIEAFLDCLDRAEQRRARIGA